MTQVVSFEGELGIRHVAELRERLLAAFGDSSSIVVKVDPDSRPDLSFVQLVESARVQARLEGKAFALASPAEGGLLSVLNRGGFLEAAGAPDLDFWLHKETLS
jgi:hypothetical protein